MLEAADKGLAIMGTQAQAASVEKPIPCVARQPILAADEKVLGYELLFRQGPEAENLITCDVEGVTCAILDTLNVIGLSVLCDGHRAFIDCTHQMLLMEYFALLPPEVVVEIQESVPADEAVVAVCQRLKEGGYMIALDDFVPSDAREALVPYADFIKVDITKVPPAESAALVARYASKACRMLAQMVETRQEFATAKKSGFTEFQGYFFRHLEHLRARQIPASQATYLRLLRAISRTDVDFGEIEDLIRREPALCYRLLRYLNSPLLGVSGPVQSIRHALNLLGERELVRWIRMATAMVMGLEKSSDLVLSSLVRARFCELIAPKVKHGKSDLYLMGLLSLMDAILEAPMGVVLEELPLEPDTKAQLMWSKTGGKTPLSPVYDLMVTRETGDWERVTKLAKELNLSLYFISETYNEALRWAHQVTGIVRPPQPQPH
jgi:EAL and modified HD-GYP domain-containing signal transduction protein